MPLSVRLSTEPSPETPKSLPAGVLLQEGRISYLISRFLFPECGQLLLHFGNLFFNTGLLQLCQDIIIIPFPILGNPAEQRRHILRFHRLQGRRFR